MTKLASNETFTQAVSEHISGEADLVTNSLTITTGALAALTVLGQVTTTGEYIQSVQTATDGSQVPVAILTEAVDASGGAVSAPAYVGGVFDPAKLVWDASFTDVHKAVAFTGSNIVLTTPAYSG